MDAKPFRPRGAENAPHLHHQHKSTGNLANMAKSTTTAGFRGPAKRAAFGDVTNVSKQGGHLRDEGKSIKVYATNGVNHGPTGVPLNKENGAHGKDTFTRPAQRPANQSSTRTALENKNFDANKKTYVRKDSHVVTKAPASSSAQNAPSLQPRHHKSQPQLKPQQQQSSLRRTQSKQLDKVVPKPDAEMGYKVTNPAAHQLQETEYPYDQTAYLDSMYLPIEAGIGLDTLQKEEHEEPPAKLPEISEEVAVLPCYEEGPVPAMSEPEECWEEEDDEDFDDQDQAYMTAHSVRSRDMTAGGATEIVPLPRVTARVQRELEDAREEVERTRTDDEIEEELWDVSMVAEYGDEIFEYMRELEIKMLPNAHYMDNQTEIQWSMRAVLMDWLVQVHNRFGLLPETLFLTVNYIDRFLSQKIVSIGKLQLVGATAILVASKYEEINCPSLAEIVYMVDNGYTAEEVLKAERFMLSMLSFELGWPGPMSFLRRVSKADDYDLETRTLAKYFLELTIMDERFVASPPSFLAAGAHCLSRLILKKGDWTKQHVYYSGYTWSQLRSLVTMMIECCDRPHLHHAAVFDKYTDRRYKEASLLVQAALDAGFTLPNQMAPVRQELDAYREDSAEVPIAQPQLIPIEG
ncbi:B-type cyclin [Fusarium irregulare]|uniref:B-type cyclin n=1 Tax=Fusarium irregulare TaxID=2494466 RepID=A0A9W8PLP9_9HYPO|nr:B-type cyclin [Fusarium irregulare]KAJ4019820.1 B-type cyclin [Fusarium irregulare]